MTGAAFSLRTELLHADRVGSMFAELLMRSGNLTPAMDEIGSSLLTSIGRRFEDGQGPDGQAWKPSRRAEEEGGQTLVDRGIYRDSFTYVAGRMDVEVGTNDIRAGILNFGGRITPKASSHLTFQIGGHWVSVDHVDITARPVLGLDGADDDEIEAIALDYLAGAFR